MAKQNDTQPDLHRQSRADLVEIIYAMQQEHAAREAETDAELVALRAENANLQAQLADRAIKLEQTGSIAQAALAVNKVFEAAQAAADQYVESACAAERAKTLSAANAEAEAMLQATRTKCDAMVADAKKQADAKWEEFRVKVLHMARTSPELQAKLGGKV